MYQRLCYRHTVKYTLGNWSYIWVDVACHLGTHFNLCDLCFASFKLYNWKWYEIEDDFPIEASNNL